ncbi:EH signature domain-containing protein [Oscillatoria sp. HE19RPO]|uniref:EH signature domain-containing protein n=1 Tax=Oscillatoria sp. HE19RPO TaxID=2954806 RepID=UPI0020C29390|nr:EH signature domain-containing protein [Oscillatoria sp. HE19RPO]
MNFNFRPLELPPLPQPKAQELINLANGTDKSGPIAPPQLPPNIPIGQGRMPRSLDDILADIENGTGEQVTILEWVYLFYAKETWDEQQGSDRAKSTSAAIWKFALSDEKIKDRLFWRLAIYYSQGNQNQRRTKKRPVLKNLESSENSEVESDREKVEQSKISDRPVLPVSLVHCFPNFASEFKKTDLLPVDILLALVDNQGNRQIASWSFQNSITPKKLLEKARLPKSLGSKHGIFIEIIKYFINTGPSRNLKEANLIIKCLEDMGREPQIQGVQHLLTKVSTEIAGQFPILVNWVQQHYGIASDGTRTRWSELSQRAKTALQDWIGALSYGYFVKLVQILLDKLDLPGWERNQLERRREFWSNYSDRFERLRILLPQSSQKATQEAIGSEFEHQDISILQEDGSDPTEVCIFDFGHCCIVEFFRGTGSETRIFNAQDYPDIKTKLFQSPTLSLKRLRYLGGEIHDHKYLWQASCEKLLRNRNIYPNEGTQYFKGLHKNYSQYNRETGLPEPSPRKQEDRENELKRWEKDMREIKIEASLFCRQLES